MALPVNYQDDVLDTTVNTQRTFNIVDANGNLIYEGCHIEETTVFTTEGSEMGSSVINATNTKVNELDTALTVDDNGTVGTLKFAIDEHGNYGYKKVGADSVTPFKKDQIVDIGHGHSFTLATSNKTFTTKSLATLSVGAYGNGLGDNGWTRIYVNNVIVLSITSTSGYQTSSKQINVKPGDTIRYEWYVVNGTASASCTLYDYIDV